MANRLSENGKFTVCVLEAGRDDARLPDLLPDPSPANVPQPGDYQWGKYVRGGSISNFEIPLINRGFGALRFYQKEDENGPDPFRSTTYHRHSGWGGCTSHNATFAIRNPPENWDQWAALGLEEWSFNNINNFYKKVENRSQVSGIFGPFFSESVPLGHLGSFDPNFYGYNGEVPLLYFDFIPAVPPFNTFVNTVQNIVNTTFAAYGYPTFLVDAD